MDMHLEGVLVPLIIFTFIGVVTVAPQWRRSRERMAAIEAIRSVTEKGQPVPAELMRVLEQTHKPKTGLSYLLGGLICLALAAGLLVMAFSQYHFSRLAEPYVNGGIVGSAAFPGFIGVVLVVFWWVNRRRLDD